MPESEGLKQFSRVINIATACAVAAILVFMGVILFTPETPPARPSENDNLQRWGALFQRHALESSGGRWPGLRSDNSVWVPSLWRLVRELAYDPELLLSAACPDPEESLAEIRTALQVPVINHVLLAEVMGRNYGYFGYAVRDLAEFERVRAARASKKRTKAGAAPDEALHELRDGVERVLFGDSLDPGEALEAQARIPVMIDIAAWCAEPESATFAGTEVLFMDGHVEFVPLGVFPIVPQVLDVMCGSAGA